jgi:hypothetical protein
MGLRPPIVPVIRCPAPLNWLGMFGRRIVEVFSRRRPRRDWHFAPHTRQALRDWMGPIRIVPTPEGVEAQWQFAESGLLQAAGPQAAKLASVTRIGSGGRI